MHLFLLQKHSQPPVSLHGQLLWREFFYTVGDGTPNFDKMEGNPVCRQIPWDKNEEYLEAWTHVSHVLSVSESELALWVKSTLLLQ